MEKDRVSKHKGTGWWKHPMRGFLLQTAKAMSTNDITPLERVEQDFLSKTHPNCGHSRSIDPSVFGGQEGER